MVLKSLTFYLGIDQEKKKAGRPQHQLLSSLLKNKNLNRARTQRIKRFSGKAFWDKKKRNLYNEHYKEKVRFEEMYYGVLVMVVCDSEGVVYDLWFHPASYHEVRSLRIRYRKSGWLRFLVDSFGLIGDRRYKGCEYVKA